MSTQPGNETTNGTNKEKQDGSVKVKDLRNFSEGAVFEPNQKLIRLMIVQERDYIVFLDDKLYVRYWDLDGYGEPAPDFGEVIIRQANLEATSMLLLEKPQLEVFRRLLGESIGRLYDDRSSHNAHLMLDKAEVFLRARSRERARGWYLLSSVVATVAVLLTTLVLWIFRAKVMALLGASDGVIEVIMGTALGALGALVSVLERSDQLKIDVSAGPRVHYFEGALRIGVGAIAGFLFALAIKSNILLGAVNNSQKSLSLLLVICMVAGASERLLPSLIRQLEGTLVQRVEELQVLEEDDGETNRDKLVTSAKDKPQRPKRLLFRRRE